MPAAYLSQGLAEVGLRTRDGHNVFRVVGDANDKPAAARVGERCHDLGNLSPHRGIVLALEFKRKALVELFELDQIAPGNLRERLGRTVLRAKRAEHDCLLAASLVQQDVLTIFLILLVMHAKLKIVNKKFSST